MKNKRYYSLIATGFIVMLLCVSIFVANAINTPASHLHDEMPDDHSIANINQVISERVLKDHEIDLTFGEKTYTLKDNLTETLQAITSEIYIAPTDAKVVFQPESDEVFVYQDEVIGQEVDVESLTNLIKDTIKHKRTSPITIPTMAIEPSVKKSDLEGATALRSEFSTSVAGSQAGRKHNVTYALKAFNGMIVLPGQQVSFNETTGERTFSDNYQDATIISGGEYVQGKGGGVCQASTTLYNALIRADVQIDEVHNHSLPVKYVPLAFDAMVNDTTSDLIFTNNTPAPLYIMTGVDGDRVWVKVFGSPMESGLTIETKSETLREIKKGDKILPDVDGKYEEHIMYKGEYHRVKYPQNGKECVGYLLYYKNGELVEQKEVRHVYYPGQDGIIMEGTDPLPEGMSLPANTVDFITSYSASLPNRRT